MNILSLAVVNLFDGYIPLFNCKYYAKRIGLFPYHHKTNRDNKKKCYYSTELQIFDAKQAQNTQISIVIVAIRIFPYRHTLRNEYLLDLHNKRPLFKLVVQFLYTQCYSNA